MPKILSRPVLATPPQEEEDMLAEFTRITNGHERRNAHEGRKEGTKEGGREGSSRPFFAFRDNLVT